MSQRAIESMSASIPKSVHLKSSMSDMDRNTIQIFSQYKYGVFIVLMLDYMGEEVRKRIFLLRGDSRSILNRMV